MEEASAQDSFYFVSLRRIQCSVLGGQKETRCDEMSAVRSVAKAGWPDSSPLGLWKKREAGMPFVMSASRYTSPELAVKRGPSPLSAGVFTHYADKAGQGAMSTSRTGAGYSLRSSSLSLGLVPSAGPGPLTGWTLHITVGGRVTKEILLCKQRV